MKLFRVLLFLALCQSLQGRLKSFIPQEHPSVSITRCSWRTEEVNDDVRKRLKHVHLINKTEDLNSRGEGLIAQIERGLAQRLDFQAKDGVPQIEYIPFKCVSRIAAANCFGSNATLGAFTIFQTIIDSLMASWYQMVVYHQERWNCTPTTPIHLLSTESPTYWALSPKDTRGSSLEVTFHKAAITDYISESLIHPNLTITIPRPNDGYWNGSQLLPVAPALHSRRFLASIVVNIYQKGGTKLVGGSRLRSLLCEECTRAVDCMALCRDRLGRRIAGFTGDEIYSSQSQSIFCLHPWGDSGGRKSFCDALLAGCINVIFSPRGYETLDDSFGNYSLYSLLVPLEKVEKGILTYLQSVPKETIKQLHLNIQSFREKFVYSATSVPPGHTDAIALIVSKLAQNMKKAKKMDIDFSRKVPTAIREGSLDIWKKKDMQKKDMKRRRRTG